MNQSVAVDLASILWLGSESQLKQIHSQRKLATPIPERREKALKAADEELPRQVHNWSMIRRIAILLILIAYVMANSDEICHGGECYPRIFEPTEEFQSIKEGQEIPTGTPSSIPHSHSP